MVGAVLHDVHTHTYTEEDGMYVLDESITVDDYDCPLLLLCIIYYSVFLLYDYHLHFLIINQHVRLFYSMLPILKKKLKLRMSK